MSHGIIKDRRYWKNEKEKDRLRIGGGSWSINLGDVDFDEVDLIIFCTEKAHYLISSINAKLHGFERTLGGEQKLVVPVKYWEERPKHDTTGKA